MSLKDKYKKSEKKATMLRAIFYGPDGSGKTHTALKIARHLVGPDGDILVIDTEVAGKDAPRSGQIEGYDHYIHPMPLIEIEKSKCYDLLVEAFENGVEAGASSIIIDSFTDESIMYLDQARTTGDDKKYFMKMKPKREKFFAKIANSPVHVILCMRAHPKGVWEGESGSRGKIIRMAEQEIGTDLIGFFVNTRIAFEELQARIVKSIYPEIQQGATYDVVNTDMLERALVTALDSGVITKERFEYELRKLGVISLSAMNELKEEIPNLGKWSENRHDEMLDLIKHHLGV